jgi:cytidyltransferase-like protein
MVLADGCFDPLHCGHLKYLRAAVALGRPLVVNIAPDEEIVAKGRQPFQNRDERAQTILALDMVDRVSVNALATAIRELKPRYVVKGAEWRGKLPEDVLAAAQDVGASIAYLEIREKTSSERLHDIGSV